MPPLLLGRRLVRDGAALAGARRQRSRKIDHGDPIEAVELHFAEMTLLDVHGNEALADLMGRPGIEVTGTAERAVAVLEPLALETPIRVCHEPLPRSDVVSIGNNTLAGL